MLALTHNREARVLAVGYFLSKCGEFAFEAAFAVTIVSLAGADILSIGVAYFFRYLPSLVFSPLGGWLADNVDKRQTLFRVEMSKSAFAVAFYVVLTLATPALPVIICLSMIMTALECLYVPTFRAYLPDLIVKDKLASANSGLQIIEDAASILGPLLFAVFVLLWSSEATFLFFAVFLFASGLSAAFLKKSSPSRHQELDGRALLLDGVRSVAQLKASNAPLYAVIGCTTVCAMFATSVVRFILPSAVLEYFVSEAVVGYVFSLLATGTVLGGALYTRINNHTTVRLVLWLWIIYGAFFLAAAVALKFNSWLFLMILFMVGFVGALVDIAIVTNIQQLSANHDIGKNFSIYYLTAVFGDAVSGLVAGLFFIFVGPATFICMALMLFIAPVAWSIRGRNYDFDSRL